MPEKEAVLAEISREVPEKFKDRAGFVMNAYGCSVFENCVSEHKFIYTAVNNVSGKSEIIDRRKTPLTNDEKKLVKFALKIRDCGVGGLGRLEVGEGTTLAKLKQIVRELFREILPKYGYKIREEQIKLAEELLDAINGRKTLLAEAPTGLGKTLVYIIIGILIRRSGINLFWSSGCFPGMTYVEYLRMGILVSTSSIALQKAIRAEVIPELSRILTEQGIIREPIKAVLRKGREHYICEYNLIEYIPFENDPKIRQELNRLLTDYDAIDLAETDALTAQVKNKIKVPTKCYVNCPLLYSCRYCLFRETAKKTGYDFIICNHQLLLADMKLRAEDSKGILPPYQTLILDEAHKVLPAARTLYGAELSAEAIPIVSNLLAELNFTPLVAPETDSWKIIRDVVGMLSEKLYKANNRLFSKDDAGEQCDKTLRKIREITDLLLKYLPKSREFKVLRDERLKHSLLWVLKHISSAAEDLSDSDIMIRWFVTDSEDERTAIGGIPKDLKDRLYNDLWKRGIPTMLTSGTLSVGGDFTALKQSLGLDHKQIRLAETTHTSPFNYKENCLIYLSQNVPDYREDDYNVKLTNEIERLIKTSNGHAAILFTSYKCMRVIHGLLKQRLPEMKDFVLERGTSTAIEQFKVSGNGVLFACGSMWEGIDCPGDILSLLIITKLPFAQPDAISEYEQTLYSDFGAYFDSVIMPDMLIKTKQAHGRGFRKENDTCVVAVCDCRASDIYRKPLLAALPECRVTADIRDVEGFIRAKKPDEYFK